MTRTEWVCTLSRSPADTVRGLAGIVTARLAVELTRPPAAASVGGAAARPATVVVTTCEVRGADVLGTSVVLGADAEKARHCAIVDAALQLAIPECAVIERVLETERRALATTWEQENDMVTTDGSR